MNIDLEVLREITSTAVQSAGIRDYDISPLLQKHVRPDGTTLEIELAPPPEMNELYDIDACVRAYLDTGAHDVYVGEECITILHDTSRTRGYSECFMKRSETIRVIEKHFSTDIKPEIFERLAKLYFGADSFFIDRLRKLQWKRSGEETKRIANVSKSADAHEIAQVMDENQILFQDVSLIVTASYFVLPVETNPVEIELHIVANAESQTISFAPAPGVMMKHHFAAMQEVRDVLNSAIGSDAAVLGKPKV